LGNWLKLWVPVIIVSLIISITLASSVDAQGKYSIPAWVKGVAGFWAEDKITDDEFGEGLSFLIEQEIIKVPQMKQLEKRIQELESENVELKSQEGRKTMQEPIVVYTDKKSYSEDEIIVVFGRVREILSGFPVSLQVFAPSGNLVTLGQPEVNEDGLFAYSFLAGGIMPAGEYTVTTLYGSDARVAQTTFRFDLGATCESDIDCPPALSCQLGICLPF